MGYTQADALPAAFEARKLPSSAASTVDTLPAAFEAGSPHVAARGHGITHPRHAEDGADGDDRARWRDHNGRGALNGIDHTRCRSRLRQALDADAVDVLARTIAHEILLKTLLTGGRGDDGAHRRVGHGVQTGLHAKAQAQIVHHLTHGGTVGHHEGAVDVRGQIAIAKAEP